MGHSYLVTKHTRAQLFREKKVLNSYLEAKFTGAQLLEQNILGHSSLEEQNTGTQLFRGNNSRTHTFRAKKSGTQLFGDKKYGDTAIQCKNILGHSCLEPKNCGKQQFRGKIYWGRAIQSKIYWVKAILRNKIQGHIIQRK